MNRLEGNTLISLHVTKAESSTDKAQRPDARRLMFGLIDPNHPGLHFPPRYLGFEESTDCESVAGLATSAEVASKILMVSGFDAAVGERIANVLRVDHRDISERKEILNHRDISERKEILNVYFESGKVGEIVTSWHPGKVNRFMRVHHDRQVTWLPKKSHFPMPKYPPWHQAVVDMDAQLLASICLLHDDCRANLELGRACAAPDLDLGAFRVWRPEMAS